MPKLLHARPAHDATEEHQLRKLAASRHGPADWIRRARIIVRSWDGLRTTAIAAEVGCHPQTVREWLARFNAEGLAGLGDRPGAGRKRRLTETERSRIIALVATTPPGRLIRDSGGMLAAADPRGAAYWTFNAQAAGIWVERSQVRRILLADGVRWRQPRSWATGTDPEFVPKEPRSSRSTPTHQRRRPSSASMSWGP
jgi:transposase